MGKCFYCGESAGWLKSSHEGCQQANTAAKAAMVELIGKWVPQHPDLTDFQPLIEELNQIAARGHIDETTARAQSRDGIYAALNAYLDDNLLSKLEEEHLFEAAEALGVDTDYLWKHPQMLRFVGAGAIRRVLEEEPWDKPWTAGQFGIILGPGEELLWVFPGLTLREPKTSRSFVGGTSGISVKLARGVYYRVGQFKGHPIDRTEVVEVGNGSLGLTNQHMYFVSPMKGWKIPYRKLVAITPFDDGIGVQRDGVSTKPQYLQGCDGWLLYNMVMNFAQRDQEVNKRPR